MADQAGIHSVTTDEINPTAQMLWSALRNDPIFRAMMPDLPQRERVGVWFCETIIRMGRRLGAVYIAEGGAGAAVWIAPGNTDMPTATILRAGFWKIPFKIGLRGMIRFNNVSSLTLRAHKEAVPGPHWYLAFIGVSPESQRGGIGAALVRRGIADADAAGLPCYLETATERGRAFFSKQGFEVVYQAPIGDDTIYAMVRRPQSKGSAI